MSNSPENHEWADKTKVMIVYLQLKFDDIQNDYLSKTQVFLAGIELKKYSAWEGWINSFIWKEY